VQPVGPDDEVEPARGALGEGDVHTVRVRVQCRDGVVEHELGLLAGGAVQDCGELGPRHLDLGAVRLARGHLADPSAGCGDESQSGHAGRDFAQAGQGAHLRSHVHCLPADIDGVTAGALPRGALDYGRLEPVAREPVSQRRARHARPGNQHRVSFHSSTLSALNAELQ